MRTSAIAGNATSAQTTATTNATRLGLYIEPLVTRRYFLPTIRARLALRRVINLKIDECANSVT
jgi:hypothetical protein